MSLVSGHIAVPMEKEDIDQMHKHFVGLTRGLVRLQPGGWVFPDWNPAFLDDIFQFKFRASDVLVMTYPKCGTTWTQEIVWTMRNNPDLNHQDANMHVFARSPFMEADVLVTGDDPTPLTEPPLLEALSKLSPDVDPKDRVFLKLSKALPNPRTLKTHLPFSLMPKNLLDTCKVIYVARNPLDACVSYCHHCRILKLIDYNGTLSDFVDYYVKGNVFYGSYMEHFKEAWSKRGHKNLHFMFFEDSKKDPLREIKKLNSFLGTELSDEVLSKIVDYTSFSAMKKRPIFGHESAVEGKNPKTTGENVGFFRKGEVGDWKQRLTKEDEEKIRSWMEAALESIDFKFQEEAGE